MTANKKEILKLLETGNYKGLFDLFDCIRGPYAAAYLLNALAEDEITENANNALTMLKKKLDKGIDWTK